MLERLRFHGPALVAIWLVWAFVFYAGKKITAGDNLGATRGRFRNLLEYFNDIIEFFGRAQTGYGVMTLAVFGAVFSTVYTLRDP